MQVLESNKLYRKAGQIISAEQRAQDHLSAKLLASAIRMRCPKAYISYAGADSYGFTCEFSAQESFSKELLPFLEESMYAILEKKEIRCFEMVRDNAVEWLSFQGNKKRAKELSTWLPGLISMVELGGYSDFIDESFNLEEALDSLYGFKLLNITVRLDQDKGFSRYHIAIKGVCALSQQELKYSVKKMKEAQKLYQEIKPLWTLLEGKDVTGLIWLPEGVELKNKLLALWGRCLAEDGFKEIEIAPLFLLEELKNTLQNDLKSYFYRHYEESDEDCLTVDLFQLLETTSVTAVAFCETEEKLAAVLTALIEKWRKMATDFDWDVIAVFNESVSKIYRISHIKDFVKKILLSSRWIEELVEAEMYVDKSIERFSFCVVDGFDRHWEIITLEISYQEKSYCLKASWSNLERWVALLVHQGGHAKLLMDKG
ncbi:MAG: hypothetical protein WCG10_04495 [Chlamydiota bacterium]